MDSSLIYISIALFTWGIGESMFIYFQPIYLARLGADPLQIGGILGAAGAAMTLAHIPAGHLADRLGRRPLLISAWIVGTVAAWLMALSNSLPFFVAGLLFYSLTAFVASPLSSYITAARGRHSIGQALTLLSATYNLGAVLGPLFSGWLAQAWGLRVIYFAAAGLFILSSTFIFLIPNQPPEQHDPSNRPASLFANPRYLGFLALGFFVFFALYLPQPFTPKFLQDVRGFDLQQIGLLGSLGGLGNAALSYLLGRIQARRGFILGQVSVAAFSLFLWRFTGFGWAALAYFLLGGYRAGRSLYMAEIRPLVHPSQMGLAYGIGETIGGLTISLAPLLAGYLYMLAPESIYPWAFAAVMIGIFLSLGFAPRELPASTVLQPQEGP